MRPRLPALLLALPLLAAAPVQADYSKRQFENILRGYLEINRGAEVRQGALRLYNLGLELHDPDLLRDATHGAIDAQDLELAMRISRDWIANGGDAEALSMLARIHISSGQQGLMRAIPLLTRLARATEDPGEIFELVSLARGDRIFAMQSVYAKLPKPADYHAYLALLYLREGFLDEAGGVIGIGLAGAPDSINLRLLRMHQRVLAGDELGTVAAMRELAEAAVTDEATAVTTYEDWRHQHEARAVLLPMPEDYHIEDGRRHYAHLRAGVFYLRYGAPEDALAELERVAQHSPSWEAAIDMRVAAHQLLDEDDKIMALLEDALSHAPEEAVGSLGQTYARQLAAAGGSEAAYEFLASFEKVAGNPDLLYYRSLYADRIGKIESAEADLRNYIRMLPDDAEGYNALGYLFADHNINLEEARELIETALAIEPDSAAIVDSYGWVLYRLGDLEGARRALEESLHLMGNDPHVEVIAHYGEVLWELGLQDDAIRVWKRGWEIDSEDEALVETMRRYNQERGAELH